MPAELPASFTTALAGKSSAGGLVPEPIEGDSLTRFLRSLTNLLGTSGQDLFGAGRETYAGGLKTFEQPLSYWSKLLSGDPRAMTEAIAPEAGMIVSQYDAARRAVSTQAPRGGARSTTLAELPFRQATDINTLLQSLRPEAAKQVTSIADLLSKYGLAETGLGQSQLAMAIQGLLTRRGQNVQESEAQQRMIGDLGQGIGAIIAALIGQSGSKPGGG